MTKKFVVITNKRTDEIDFFLICHAACNKIGNFQWFITDDPNYDFNKSTVLEEEVYESITLSSKWIRENAENKWLGCHCLLKDDEYTEILCCLSSDILSIFRNNTVDMIDVCDSNGNIKKSTTWNGTADKFQEDLVKFAEENWLGSHVEMLKSAIQCVLDGKEVYVPIEEDE